MAKDIRFTPRGGSQECAPSEVTGRTIGGRPFLAAGIFHMANDIRPTQRSGSHECAPSEVTGRTNGGRPFLAAGIFRLANDIRPTQLSGSQECAPSEVTGRTIGGRPFLAARIFRLANDIRPTQRSGAQECAPSEVTGRTIGGRPFLAAGIFRLANDIRPTQRSGAQECAPSEVTGRTIGGRPFLAAGIFRMANDIRPTQRSGAQECALSEGTGRIIGTRALPPPPLWHKGCITHEQGKGYPLMKINFGSTYKEVEQLLKASLKPTSKVDDAGFEKSLGSLLSQPVESPKKNADVLTNATPPALPKSPMEEVKASYRFDNPGLMMPDLDPLSPPETQAIPSENGGMSVKTPTLLEARRVTLEPTKMMSSLEGQPMALQSLLSPQGELTAALSPLQPPLPSKIEVSKVSEGTAPKVMPPQLGEKEILSRLNLASQKVGLDPSLAMAVVKAESGFNVRAVSSDGHYSKGLFQLLDTTGKHLLSRAETPTDQDYDPFDPDLNIQLGTSYLRYLHDIFRTPTQLPNARTTKSAADDKSLEQLAVAAFNAGEGRVAAAQHRTEQAGKDPAHYDNVAPFLPRSTREYVARVVGGKRLF